MGESGKIMGMKGVRGRVTEWIGRESGSVLGGKVAPRASSSIENVKLERLKKHENNLISKRE